MIEVVGGAPGADCLLQVPPQHPSQWIAGRAGQDGPCGAGGSWDRDSWAEPAVPSRLYLVDEFDSTRSLLVHTRTSLIVYS